MPRRLGLSTLLLLGCTPRPAASPEPEAPVAVAAAEPLRPPLPLHTLGLTTLSDLNYPYREGRDEFDAATEAAQLGQWNAVEELCRAVLAVNPIHTGARRLLAAASSSLGQHGEAADQLNMALADDWLAWGPSIDADADLAALRRSGRWSALAELNDDYRERVTAIGTRGLWAVGRRTAYQPPSVENGPQFDTTRAEVVVWDAYEGRFHRVSHTAESVLGFARISDGDFVLVTSRLIDPGPERWRLHNLEVVRFDAETLTPEGTHVSIEGVFEAGALHVGDDANLVLTLEREQEEGGSVQEAFALDFGTGSARPVGTRPTTQLGDLVFTHPRTGLAPEPPAVTCTGSDCRRGDGAEVQLAQGTPDGSYTSADGKWAVVRTVSPDGRDPAPEDGSTCKERHSTLQLVALQGEPVVHPVHEGINTFHRVRWESPERFVFEADQNTIMRFDRETKRSVRVVYNRAGIALNGLGAQQGPCDAVITREIAKLEGKWIEVSETIQFETDKATLLPESLEILDAVASVLDEHPEIQLVQIQGHTDRHASHAYNMRLSVARAHAVVEDLVVRGGIDPQRLVARGFGKTRMLDKATTADADLVNRRVSFRILKQKRKTKRRKKSEK